MRIVSGHITAANIQKILKWKNFVFFSNNYVYVKEKAYICIIDHNGHMLVSV